MEVIDENNLCCFGCLCTEEEFHLQQVSLQCEPLKTIFQVASLILCTVCKRITQRADLFIQNVQSNQILLQNFHNDLSSLQTIPAQVQPCISLAYAPLPYLELSGTGTEECCIVLAPEQKIKLEPKEELYFLEGDFIDGGDDFQDQYVKEEDLTLASLLKEELQSVDSNDLETPTTIKKKLKKKERIVKSKKIIKKRNGGLKATISVTDLSNYSRLLITEKQCKMERQKRMQEEPYLGSMYKCEHCIKGFSLKEAFTKHMISHSLSSGQFSCPICKQRFESSAKLRRHKRCHFIRYKCLDCGVIRVCLYSIKEHYAEKHTSFRSVFKCAHCPKVFNNKRKHWKHESYTHSRKGRVICNVCSKSYVNKDSLLSHILRKHPPDGATDKLRNRHVCAVCGCAFAAPSGLRNHALVHTEHRDYYCVECDRSFKTAAVLKQHLKTATPHVNYLELPLSCEHCEKRFSIKRDLERHINRVHLNIKPFTCDKCDRAYINSWSLRDHQRYSHEGVKRPLRYPCAMCDKVFDRSSILKSHVRTHTGERPYHCAQCPAQFAQGSALGTHVKLVHLKLTRDGRPKQASIK